MKPVSHLSVSIIVGVATFLTTKLISPSIACFLVGWLVDVDHIWDFYKNGCRGFNIKRFVYAMENGEIKKIYLYFHSYELLLVLVVLCYFTHFNYILSFTTIGFATHLFLDQIFNNINTFSYFITYRILNDYKSETIFRIHPHGPSRSKEQENEAV